MLNQNPRQADFVLGTCPHCQKVVRIPVTAVTAQTKSHVCCPICDAEFEIAEILDDTIPSVKVVDEAAKTNRPAENDKSKPDRINAIDTPELFHVSKDDYRPSTEKKNGRFVVPELLSKGIKGKRARTRKHTRRSQNDPKLAESLAKLKKNTSATSVPRADEANDAAGERNDSERSSRSHSERGRSDRKRSPESGRSGRSNSSSSRATRMRSFSDFKRILKSWKIGARDKIDTARNGKSESRFELAMIGVGVLLAIPMVHLMMWWFAGIDPLGLARPTSYVVPFIVPNELKQPAVVKEVVPEMGKQQSAERPAFINPNDKLEMKDGKLPTPKIDPSSIHVDEDY